MPCNVKKRDLCETLSDRLNQESNAHKKGFTTIVIFSSRTRKFKTIGVAYKKNSKDEGVMLNFCPFCGESLKGLLKGSVLNANAST